MEVGTVVVALILVFIAWKVLTGLVKVGVIVLVIAAAAYFLLGGF